MVQLGALSEEWRNLLDDEFRQPYLSELSVFLRGESIGWYQTVNGAAEMDRWEEAL